MKYLTLIITLPILLCAMIYCIMHDWIADSHFYNSLTFKLDQKLELYSRWIKK